MPAVKLTLEYGRKLTVSETQMSEWLDDLPEQIDEIIVQPLRTGNDCHSTFSPFAFCAPEIIRGAVTAHILKTNLSSHEPL